MQCVSVQPQFFILLSLYLEILLEIGFIEEMRITWANNTVQQILVDKNIQEQKYDSFTETESSRTRLEVLGLENQVLGLGLKASSPRKYWPVLGSRTALFFELLKCCGAPEKFLWRRFLFFFEFAWKTFLKTFFGEHLRFCPCSWPGTFLSLAWTKSVFGRVVLGLGLGFFSVLGLGLEPCVLDTTSAPLSNLECWIRKWTPFLQIRLAFFKKVHLKFFTILAELYSFSIPNVLSSRSCYNSIVKSDRLDYECKSYYRQQIECPPESRQSVVNNLGWPVNWYVKGCLFHTSAFLFFISNK